MERQSGSRSRTPHIASLSLTAQPEQTCQSTVEFQKVQRASRDLELHLDPATTGFDVANFSSWAWDLPAGRGNADEKFDANQFYSANL